MSVMQRRGDGMVSLQVFREVDATYERVGMLESDAAGAVSFSYDPQYLASARPAPISLSLPLQQEPFESVQAAGFFEGLLPEGEMRRALSSVARASIGDTVSLLSRLNNESVGGLVFSTSTAFPTDGRHYEPLSFERLEEFAARPLATASEFGSASRLSLAGAQTKIGLYHQSGTDPKRGWFLPRGSAPSNTIVKVSAEQFPLQTINEAFCLTVARLCGFDTEGCELIPVDGHEPLLAVRRFDRTSDSINTLDGLSLPARLHQEDFCQASGLPAFCKYEPTDGHYVERCCSIISRSSSNPFGDRMMFIESLLLDFIIGNCDNHLKNHSLLWNSSWSSRELAPLYDITCTTMYPELDREMGVSLCRSRRIDDVSAEDLEDVFARAGLSLKMGWTLYRNLCAQVSDALPDAEQELLDQGFDEVRKVASFIEKDSLPRRSLHP